VARYYQWILIKRARGKRIARARWNRGVFGPLAAVDKPPEAGNNACLCNAHPEKMSTTTPASRTQALNMASRSARLWFYRLQSYFVRSF